MSENTWKGLLAGVSGGLAASWVMNQFQALLSAASQNAESGKGQGEGQSGDPATVKAAEAVAGNVFGHRLTSAEKEPAGNIAHYVMGAVSGGLYGAIAENVPAATAGAGTLFGGLLWAAADEAAVPALGLSKAPTEYPLSSHARALASHLVYGVTTELIRRGLRSKM